MTTYEKLKESLDDGDIYDAKSYAIEMDRELAVVTKERDRLLAKLDLVERACDTATYDRSRLLEKLAFAASVIKSGEPWTRTCENVIGKALEDSK